METAKTINHRIAFLDALRGIAIVLVILFHAYSRWPDIYPYGSQLASFPLFQYGRLGVQLFFLISGFVILMTLEKCSSFQEFILRRWFRLFPAMLICSIIIFVSAPLFPERPNGPAVLRDLLPGLTFIKPEWWELILHSHQGVLEGSFWSLFVEMKFYFLFGALYFWKGEKVAIAVLIVLSFVCYGITFSERHTVMDQTNLASVKWFLFSGVSAHWLGWFASGALFYRYFCDRTKTLLLLSVTITFITALVTNRIPGFPYWPHFLIAALFTLSVISSRVQAFLIRKPLLFLGFVSYPLYLLHENMMVAMTAKVGKFAPGLPAFTMALIPITGIAFMAWIIARYLEPLIKTSMQPLYKRLQILFKV